ncbi:MAG: RNA polymerase sporulation sigma factor SigH [Acidimicrobiales bacterium]
MSLRLGTAALTDVTDDELAVRAQGGENLAQLALIERYRRFARSKGRGYFLVGGDSEDVEQEALIGLYKAIRDYQPDRQASFRAFAELCITRQIITAIKTATRQKHQALNQYVSLSGVRGGDDTAERSIEELLDDHNVADPADHVVSAERMEGMRSAMAEMLSGLEVDVLRLYVEGKSYQEIGVHLGRHVKSIDNALQRIKRKVEGHLADVAVVEQISLAS